MKTANEQTPERVTIKRVKIDDEAITLDVVRRGEKKFVFEIMRENGNRMVASSDEHKKAKRAGRESRSGSGQSRLRCKKSWINKPENPRALSAIRNWKSCMFSHTSYYVSPSAVKYVQNCLSSSLDRHHRFQVSF